MGLPVFASPSRKLFALAVAAGISVLSAPVRALDAHDGADAPVNPVNPVIQYVVVSFDGGSSLEMWQETRDFAHETDIKFTYFQSCTYLLHWGNKRNYDGPRHKAGRSNVGFSKTVDEIAARLDQINGALDEGHELASHGCGHFDGRKWSAKDWNEEFQAFKTILRDAYTLNDLPGEPDGWAERAAGSVVGWRAPYLSRNAAMDSALAAEGFRYDASGVGNMGEKPPRTGNGLWDFRLALIPEGPKNRKIVSMDYNWFVRHSSALSRPQNAALYQRRTEAALNGYFNHTYSGDRQPIHIGLHFAKWNGGAYWNATKAFTSRVCRFPDVRCVSYRELADALDTVTVAASK